MKPKQSITPIIKISYDEITLEALNHSIYRYIGVAVSAQIAIRPLQRTTGKYGPGINQTDCHLRTQRIFCEHSPLASSSMTSHKRMVRPLSVGKTSTSVAARLCALAAVLIPLVNATSPSNCPAGRFSLMMMIVYWYLFSNHYSHDMRKLLPQGILSKDLRGID